METDAANSGSSGDDTSPEGNVVDTVGEPEPLDLGEVTAVDERVPYEREKTETETARFLTLLLVWMLGISFALHYGATAAFRQWGDDDVAKALSSAFEVWLPVISGFVGSTVTYYFTRKK